MLKTMSNMLIGAFLAAAVGAAYAVVGNAPVLGYQTPDGSWLLGLAGGQNNSYQYGITAAGTTHATSIQLPAGVGLLEVDTVPASSGASLPPAVAGTEIKVYNSTATTILYYPSIANNVLTGAQDTINGATSLSVTGVSGGTLSIFVSAKNGIWAAK